MTLCNSCVNKDNECDVLISLLELAQKYEMNLSILVDRCGAYKAKPRSIFTAQPQIDNVQCSCKIFKLG